MAIDLIALIISPHSKEFFSRKNNELKDKKEKFEEILKKCNISLIFALFIFTLFALQLFGLYNYNKTLNLFSLYFNNINAENIAGEPKNNSDIADNGKRIPIEYYIINEIYSLLKIKK